MKTLRLFSAACLLSALYFAAEACKADIKTQELEAQAPPSGRWVQDSGRVWYCLLAGPTPDGLEVVTLLSEFSATRPVVSFQAIPTTAGSAVLVVVTD